MTDKWELADRANKRAAAYNHQISPLDIQRWFDLAWAREVPYLLPMPDGLVLNLGAGKRMISDSVPLDLENGWDAERYTIPYGDDSVAGIWAHGFFEHLTPQAVIRTLRDCERVLKTNGVLNIVVPHALCENAVEEIEHYTPFTENSIANLIANPYYQHQAGDWKLEIYATFIMGVVWRNMAVFSQLVKV